MLRACSQGCARTTQHTPSQTKKNGKEKKQEEERKRVVLDGGGARLADAATRHHLTRTRKKRKHGEQNKHQRTQTIQKTSTRKSTTNRHHTLPSMRSQTPIQQQRTTQTQQCRSRPHNPSLVRRNQPPGQRKSPLRQMQQQTRQRTRRKRKSTPLPEKRKRKRQTPHSRHANTTHQHMVNHTTPFQQKKGGTLRKTEEKTRQEKTKLTTRETQWCSGITCVLAGLRAHYPEHQHKEEKKERETGRQDKQRELHTHHTHHTTAIPQPTTQYDKTRQDMHCRHNKVICRQYPPHTTRLSTQHKSSPLFPDKHTLSQKHKTKPTML